MKSKRRRYALAAGKARTGTERDALTPKWTAQKQRGYANRRLGTFGPASDVVHINPEDEDA